MTSHEVSLGDVYNLVMEVRDDVTEIKVTLNGVQDMSRDHEARLRDVETHKAPNEDINKLAEALEDLKKKVYMFSGGAVVVSTLIGPVISRFLGK